MTLPTITPEEAKARGLWSLTMPYTRNELPLLRAAAAELERDRIAVTLVEKPREGIEIWRGGKQYTTANPVDPDGLAGLSRERMGWL